MNKKLLIAAIEHAKTQINEGKVPIHKDIVAVYIPELAKADPLHIGVSAMTVEGKWYNAGDWEEMFTMQSISKLIALILALKIVGEQGKDEFFRDVAGMEPSGDAFNSIMKLESKSIVPSNPMINAGAISVAGFCVEKGNDPHALFLDLARKLCGRSTIGMDDVVYLSEKKTGFRNRAMAYLMQSDGVLKCGAEEAADLYFKMCSTLVYTGDLAHFAMILANNGRDLNNNVLIESWIVKIVKTIMLTCGMYDDSGEFAIRVGLPAKSGVGGGIIACAENYMGIATFGPMLNPKGNSAGGILIMEQLSQKLGLHIFSGNTHYINNRL